MNVVFVRAMWFRMAGTHKGRNMRHAKQGTGFWRFVGQSSRDVGRFQGDRIGGFAYGRGVFVKVFQARLVVCVMVDRHGH